MRKFKHYVLMSWVITLGTFAAIGILYMFYGLIFLDFGGQALSLIHI